MGSTDKEVLTVPSDKPCSFRLSINELTKGSPLLRLLPFLERNIAMKIKPAFTPVNIAFAANDGYAVPLSVTLYSMMKNASKARFYDILVMHKDISPENREMLLKVAAHFPNCSLRFIDFSGEDSLVSGNKIGRASCRERV